MTLYSGLRNVTVIFSPTGGLFFTFTCQTLYLRKLRNLML
jgi:hypothetical protein